VLTDSSFKPLAKMSLERGREGMMAQAQPVSRTTTASVCPTRSDGLSSCISLLVLFEVRWLVWASWLPSRPSLLNYRELRSRSEPTGLKPELEDLERFLKIVKSHMLPSKRNDSYQVALDWQDWLCIEHVSLTFDVLS
jgi:hypothetical protein